VRCHANERLKLERLCRYITRPALANDRVKINAKGQVELKLKTPWRDGTTHHVMSPLELMQRLAALVPRPRLHLIRFHGVLAVFNLDLTQCPHCGGQLRLVAAILQRQAQKDKPTTQ
jgi:hypothetical protein